MANNGTSEERIMAEELTLESLARRIEKLEEVVQTRATEPRKKDWRRVVGIGDNSPVMEEIIKAGEAIRQADREAADQ